MLTTEERMEIAKTIIEMNEIVDEDLKQEIYMHALEFKMPDGAQSDKSAKIRSTLYLGVHLSDVIVTYAEEKDVRESMEHLASVNLKHFDTIMPVFDIMAFKVGL